MPIRATLALALVAALAQLSCSAAQPASPTPPSAGLGSLLIVAGPAEPGPRMVVTGRLFAPDGKTPAAGRRIGVYQTDASGNYGRDPRVPQWARLNGWLRTDSAGGYEIRTIRPGAYPRGGPAHIHFIVETSSGGFGGSMELRFEDDPRVSRAEMSDSRRDGRFGTVRPAVQGLDGVLRVERDLRAPERTLLGDRDR